LRIIIIGQLCLGALILMGEYCLTGLILAAQKQELKPGTKTILDGVFSAEQATKGQSHYSANCVRCHEGSEADGPILMGRSFVERWREDSLGVLFNFVKTRMPPDGNVTLSDGEYLELVSFLLNANGYSAGSNDLTTDTVTSIRIVGKNGPQPLPNNSLVQVDGCMNQNSAGAWMLDRATEPARIRKGDEPSPAVLKRSAEKPLGTQSFQLYNFTNINLDFDPKPFQGHKVHIQGVLIRQGTRERINMVSLDSVNSSCGS
jgi:cytochrome c5